MKSKKRNIHCKVDNKVFFLGNVTWFLSEYGNYPSLLHSCFYCRHATLLPTNTTAAAVSREERCVTTLKTAVQQSRITPAHLSYIKKRSRQEQQQQRQRTCWNAKKVLTFLLSVLTSDRLKQQKLTKLHKAVHIFILTFQPSSGLSLNNKEILCGEHVKL